MARRNPEYDPDYKPDDRRLGELVERTAQLVSFDLRGVPDRARRDLLRAAELAGQRAEMATESGQGARALAFLYGVRWQQDVPERRNRRTLLSVERDEVVTDTYFETIEGLLWGLGSVLIGIINEPSLSSELKVKAGALLTAVVDEQETKGLLGAAVRPGGQRT